MNEENEKVKIRFGRIEFIPEKEKFRVSVHSVETGVHLGDVDFQIDLFNTMNPDDPKFREELDQYLFPVQYNYFANL